MAFGSFDRKNASQPMAEINMVPLIDVVLVLLVIFIVTAPLLTNAVKLLSVNGVGPKMALAILSIASANLARQAIAKLESRATACCSSRTAARLLDVRSAVRRLIESAAECSSSGVHPPCGVAIGALRFWRIVAGV